MALHDALFDRKFLPPFASLRAFEAVGRLGGIRKAAQELGVDHAVVSRHIRALESWIGQPLFDRSGPSPNLNAFGRDYHHKVSAAIMTIAAATREVLRTDGSVRLLIWCVPGFASRWLAANLDDFVLDHPGLEIELRPTDASPNFGADDADGDVRFVRDISRHPAMTGVSCHAFARPNVFPVASPSWISGQATPCKPEDIMKMRLLHEENDEEWRGWFTAKGVKVGARLPGPRLWHAHLTLDAARRGQGVALTNPFLVARDVESGSLHRLATADSPSIGAEIGEYVFSARDESLRRPIVRKFRDWLTARAATYLAGASASAGMD